MNKTFTCIMCPVGCTLTAEKNGNQITISGNGCVRGERYGVSELTNPTRMVTSLVKTKNGICSVKTSAPVPKNKVFDVLKEIQKLCPKQVTQNQVLLKNVCNLENINIVVTRAN